MEEKRFYTNVLRRLIANELGSNASNVGFGNTDVSAAQMARLHTLPINATYATPLRNADGSRNYPADYAGADDVASN